MKDYQEKALRTANKNLSKDEQLKHALFGIMGEVGELIDSYKKTLYQGHFCSREDIINECGDIIWYLNLLLWLNDSSIEEAMKYNIKKLEKRYQGKFDSKKSIERDKEKKSSAILESKEHEKTIEILYGDLSKKEIK